MVKYKGKKGYWSCKQHGEGCHSYVAEICENLNRGAEPDNENVRLSKVGSVHNLKCEQRRNFR